MPIRCLASWTGVSGNIDVASLGEDQVLVESLLSERLKLVQGDKLVIGSKAFVIRDIIADEPDRSRGKFRLWPTGHDQSVRAVVRRPVEAGFACNQCLEDTI